MDENLVNLGLVVFVVVTTVWNYIVQRNRSERARRPDGGLRYRFPSFLAVFLPLVALLAALQEYVEKPRNGLLVLAGVAAVALAIGLLSLRRGPGGPRGGAGKE